jgi:hypothetical protein
MSDDLESKLRIALRAVAPREEFSRDLAARIAARSDSSSRRGRYGARGRKLAWWASVSLAASLLVAVGIHEHQQSQRERALGMQARQQVIEALRVTSQKLDLAYQAVRTQASAAADGDSGV